VKLAFPKKLTREFLLVDLVNHQDEFTESKEEALSRVRASYDRRRRQRVLNRVTLRAGAQ
jgi:hypothetical protein